jgi:hypothetical protein
MTDLGHGKNEIFKKAVVFEEGFVSSKTILFRAIQSADTAAITGAGEEYDIICNVESIDVSGDYNHTTGVFAIRDTGMYTFNAVVPMRTISTSHDRCRLRLNINSGAYYADIADFDVGAVYEKVSGSSGYTLCKSLDIYLTAGNTVKLAVKVEGGSKTIYLPGTGGNFGVSFSGHKIAV